MKKVLFLVIAFTFSGLALAAQGEKSLKQASKSLSQYLKAPIANTSALEEAKTHLATAFEDDMVKSKAKSWITRGEIFYNIGDSQVKTKLLNPEYNFADPGAGVESLAAYKEALKVATKKGEIKDAIKGLQLVESLLNNIGVELYKVEDFAGAFNCFNGEVDAYNTLKANDGESRLDAGTLRTDKLYFAGLTAYYAEEYQASIDLLTVAQETGTEEGTTYQIIFEAMRKLGQEDEALPLLQEGRKKFPDDSGLLFSEINYYLGKGQLDKMIGNLQQALDNEPDNISVLLTLGQVYDQLHVKSTEAGDKDQADAYFENSFKNYEKALSLDQNDFDLNYSLGALFYNRAAGLTPSLNEVANDFSKAGEEKYNNIKDEMAGYFDKALPYFIRADEINDTDRNTIIALKEIYARQDNFEKSNEYKDKLEALPNNE